MTEVKGKLNGLQSSNIVPIARQIALERRGTKDVRKSDKTLPTYRQLKVGTT